jgi:hypothetical protein
MERETPKKDALLVLLCLTIGKTRSASKKAGRRPIEFGRLWLSLLFP